MLHTKSHNTLNENHNTKYKKLHSLNNTFKRYMHNIFYKNSHTTQFQIEGGGVVQGVTKLIWIFSAFVT